MTVLLLNTPAVRAGGFRWTAMGPAGGQIYALAIDPITPNTLYAGTYGGVVKSTNGGGHWTVINTGLGNYRQVWALVSNPAVPDTVYAGTWDGGVFEITVKPVLLPIIIRN